MRRAWFLALIFAAGCGLFLPPNAAEGEGEGEGEGEPADPLRRVVRVEARGAAVPLGYPLRLRFDHSAMVAAGGDQLGRDLSLHLDGANIDIALEPDGGFNTNQTAIWFECPTDLGPSDDVELILEVDAANPSERAPPPFVGLDTFDNATINGQAFNPATSCAPPSAGRVVCEVTQQGGGGQVILQTRGDPAPGKAIGFLARIPDMGSDLNIAEVHYDLPNGGAQSRYFALGIVESGGALEWAFRKTEGNFTPEPLTEYTLNDLVRVDFAIDFERAQATAVINGERFDVDEVPPSNAGGGNQLTNFQTGIKDSDGAARIEFLHMYERIAVVPEPRVRLR